MSALCIAAEAWLSSRRNASLGTSSEVELASRSFVDASLGKPSGMTGSQATTIAQLREVLLDAASFPLVGPAHCLAAEKLTGLCGVTDPKPSEPSPAHAAFFLEGPRGCGKSKIVTSALRALSSQVLVLRGDAQESDSPLGAWRRAVRGLVGESRFESGESQLGSVLGSVSSLAESVSGLGLILGSSSSESAASVDASVLADVVFRALAGLASSHPRQRILVLLEEMEHADADTWTVLQILLRRAAGERLPVTFVVCAQVDSHNPGNEALRGQLARSCDAAGERGISTSVGCLAREDIGELLVGLGFDVEFARLVQSKFHDNSSGGNPLHLTQILLQLVDVPLVTRSGGGAWKFAPGKSLQDLAVPGMVRDEMK